MTGAELATLIEDAIFDYTVDAFDTALAKLHHATKTAPASFEAWHALAEISLNARNHPGYSRDDALSTALSAAQHASELRPDDLLINTTLSRIWMEKGDKTTAEKYGTRARILGWKNQLKKSGEKTSGENHFTG